MRPEPSERIDPRAVDLWRVHAFLRALLQGGFLFAIGAFALAGLGKPLTWLIGLAVAIALLALVGVFVLPPLRWRQWRYALDERELDLRHGIFFVRRTLIPLVRVQHVDTVQGPIAKWFGLSSVTVSTAAGVHEVPALSDAVADRLRDAISRLAREARDET